MKITKVPGTPPPACFALQTDGCTGRRTKLRVCLRLFEIHSLPFTFAGAKNDGIFFYALIFLQATDKHLFGVLFILLRLGRFGQQAA